MYYVYHPVLSYFTSIDGWLVCNVLQIEIVSQILDGRQFVQPKVLIPARVWSVAADGESVLMVIVSRS